MRDEEQALGGCRKAKVKATKRKVEIRSGDPAQQVPCSLLKNEASRSEGVRSVKQSTAASRTHRGPRRSFELSKLRLQADQDQIMETHMEHAK